MTDPAVELRIRISPAPPREPRFDDERPSRHLALVGRDALPLPFAEAAEAEADALAASQPATTAARGRALAVPETGRGAGPLPDPVRFGRFFVLAVVEVLGGRRPAAQLSGHTSSGVQAGLVRDQARGPRFDTGGRNPIVHSVHIMEPAVRVAELSAVVQIGPRFRAIAARMEARHGRWCCVRLQVG